MANFSSPSASLLDVTPVKNGDEKLNLNPDLRTDALKTVVTSPAVVTSEEPLKQFASLTVSQDFKPSGKVNSSADLLNSPDLAVHVNPSDRPNFTQKINDLIYSTAGKLNKEKLELLIEAARSELLAPVLNVFSTRKNTALAAGLAGGLLVVPQVIPLLAGAGAAAGIYNFSKSAGFKFKKD